MCNISVRFEIGNPKTAEERPRIFIRGVLSEKILRDKKFFGILYNFGCRTEKSSREEIFFSGSETTDLNIPTHYTTTIATHSPSLNNSEKRNQKTFLHPAPGFP